MATMTSENVANGAGRAIAPFDTLTGMGLSSLRSLYDSMPPNRDTLGLLFAVDAAQASPSEEWIGFLVETASSQLIWDERPTGWLSPEAAGWVLARYDEAPRLSVMALLVRLVEEAVRMPSDFPAAVRRRAVAFDAAAGNPAPIPSTRRGPVPYLRLVA